MIFMKNEQSNEVKKENILVVDDSPQNLKLLIGILARTGYKIRPATNGDLALATVALEPPDLILLDVKMPGMSGFEVCRRLKEDERTRDIPVIFISALGETADKVRGFETGGIDYVTKPFQAKEVLARVKTHLTLRRLQTHLEDQVKERTAELKTEVEERKQTEERLRAALDEKMILLREIHHRTRNNMGVVNALIDIYADDLEDGPARTILLDLRNRIASMAMVHNQLHQPDLTYVNLGAYIPELAKSLLEKYGISPADVALEFDLEPVTLTVDNAVPFGLLLNELICNALNNAPREMKIRIALRNTIGGDRELGVKTTGAGPGFFADSDASTSGRSLVELLAGQLKGNISIKNETSGNTVLFRFREPAYEKRI